MSMIRSKIFKINGTKMEIESCRQSKIVSLDLIKNALDVASKVGAAAIQNRFIQ